MNDVLTKLKTIGSQVSVLAALNRIPLLIAGALFALALIVWGIWAINDRNEKALDSRIAAAVEMSEKELKAKFTEQLSAQDMENQKIVTELLNKNNTALVRLETLQKKFADQSNSIETMLKDDVEGRRRVSASTREMLKQSRENFQ